MSYEEERLISSVVIESDENENILRPKAIDDYIGQEKIKNNLNVFMQASISRGEPLDHVLLYGPPGLGKTTLSHIIANEMSSNMKVTTGPAITSAGDLASILTNLEEGDVLFIDEIHRLSHSVEEILYPAMEDYKLDMTIGKGPSARIIQIPLKRFTLVGATTKAGMLSSPLRDRFGIVFRLELYTEQELSKIIFRSANILNVNITTEASIELASRSRGTPRIANRLLKRIRDFAQFEGKTVVDIDLTKKSLENLEIDSLGLDNTDLVILNAIVNKFNGGPVGLDTLAASTGEDTITIEDVYEPYLLQLGFIARTPRGRVCTHNGYKHLGMKSPFDNTKEEE